MHTNITSKTVLAVVTQVKMKFIINKRLKLVSGIMISRGNRHGYYKIRFSKGNLWDVPLCDIVLSRKCIKRGEGMHEKQRDDIREVCMGAAESEGLGDRSSEEMKGRKS